METVTQNTETLRTYDIDSGSGRENGIFGFEEFLQVTSMRREVSCAR